MAIIDVSGNEYPEITRLIQEVFPGERLQDLKKLGGLTNHNFRTELSCGDYVVRLPGEGTEQMINRSDEHISSNLANDLGIDAELVYFDDTTGIKISKYINNAITLTDVSLATDENLSLAAGIFKKLHGCGRNTKVEFNVFTMIENYENLLRINHGSFYDDYNPTKQKVLNYHKEIAALSIAPVPCHNDPLCENWIRSDSQIYLIDWEYAGMNDGIWDLADVSIEANLTKEKDLYFLKEYLGHEASHSEIRRFLINKIFLDFLWSLWGKLRGLYEDGMEEYARTRYVRAQKNIVVLERM
jgi:thiamine kinase-like enzyme